MEKVTPREMFGVEPDDGFFMVVGTRLVMLAFTFTRAPQTRGACCLPYQDGDKWRVEVCGYHAKELA